MRKRGGGGILSQGYGTYCQLRYVQKLSLFPATRFYDTIQFSYATLSYATVYAMIRYDTLRYATLYVMICNISIYYVLWQLSYVMLRYLAMRIYICIYTHIYAYIYIYICALLDTRKKLILEELPNGSETKDMRKIRQILPNSTLNILTEM